MQQYNGKKKSQEKFGGEKEVFFNNNLTWPEFIRISFSLTNCLQFAESLSFIQA